MGSWTTRILLLVSIVTERIAAQLITKGGGNLVSDVAISCNSNSIMVTISTANNFNGMIYPKGLSKNSTCMKEYTGAGPSVEYALPLRSCNTMSMDMDDGVEYFNTVVIQPHRKLVTNQGRGYHIRCRYQTKEKTITSGFNVSMLGTTPLEATAPMPECSMRIFLGDPEDAVVAENVKIGDGLTLVISIDFQDVYGIKITNCIVRDGLRWSEQPLINNDGCPVDPDIMGEFEYLHNKTYAKVEFFAHKFPYTSSVYYQCNVRMCLKTDADCQDVPPDCSDNGRNRIRRRKRNSEANDIEETGSLQELRGERPEVIAVYSGLYVSDVDEQEDNKLPRSEAQPSIAGEEFCVSTRKFAIAIAIAGVLLMLAVMLLVACILHRRRRRKGSSSADSSIYSGPYTNHAYSRD